MIKEIGHLALRVSDMKAAQDFYINKMGFRKAFEIMKNPDGGRPTEKEVVPDSGSFTSEKLWICYIQVSPDSFIEFFTTEGGEEKCCGRDDVVGYLHLALMVDDIHAYRDEIVSRGITLDIEPNLGMDGTWQMWLHDPDGNKMEVMQYTETSAQRRFRI